MRKKIVPIILSGGGGMRLWPLSTPNYPKQFLRLFGDNSLFQNTVLRCDDKEIFAAPIIVGNAKHAQITSDQLHTINVENARLLLEPEARNTAPAIALAALCCAHDDLMLVMPSDHLIAEEDIFLAAIKGAISAAYDDWLITFGISPTKPETGYGYIKCGEQIADHESCHNVPQFMEKPDLKTAKSMLDSGEYLWNAGIFLFKAGAYLSALKSHAPDILDAAIKSLKDTNTNASQIHPDKDLFSASPSDSIDYAVMEKAHKVAVTPISPGWSDVGSWDSIAEQHEAMNSDAKNIIIGNATAIDAKGNLIHSRDAEVQLIGVDNLVVVVHEGKIVILPRNRSQEVKILSD